MLHQVGQSGLGVIQYTDAGIDDLPQIVGRDIGGHANGNAGGAVHQQVGEAGGEDPGLPSGLVKVGVPVHGFFVDIPEHFLGNTGQPGLRITVGGRGISVHGTKVAVAVHQHIAHGKILCQTHQSVIYALVSVGMVPAQYVAHAGGGLFKWPVMGQIVLIHGVEDTAVDRLKSVADVGQGPAHDDAHGVFDVGLLHLRHQGGCHDDLVRIPDLLRIVLRFFTHSKTAFLFQKRVALFASDQPAVSRL